MSRGAPRLVVARTAWPALALLASFTVLYALSIDLHAPNVLWHNFVFDADIDRVMADATNAQTRVVFRRHPLFMLLLALPMSALSRLGPSPIASLRFVVACAGALGVVGARAVFFRITGDRFVALVFAVLYGLSAAVWLLSSVPETFALSAAALVGLFLMHDPSFARPRERPVRFAAFALLSALAIGTTVANAAYVAFTYLSAVRGAHPSWRQRIESVALGGVAVAVAFVALSLAQKALFAGRILDGTGIVSPLTAAKGDGFLDLGRALSAREALQVGRAFVVDNLVAPGIVVATVHEPEPTMSGQTQMIQYGDWRAPTYLLAIAALGAIVAASARGGAARSLARSHLVQLALACIAWNCGLHYFYRANGQPFLFSIHTALPVTVLLAHAYAVGDWSPRRWVATGAVAVVGLNNALFGASVRDALALPCSDRLPLVCPGWAKGNVDPRYTRGLSAYLASSDYPLDEGSVAIDHGDAAGAERFYREALAKTPDSLAAERGLGVTLWMSGRPAQAIEHLQRVADRDPGDDDVCKLLSRLTVLPQQ